MVFAVCDNVEPKLSPTEPAASRLRNNVRWTSTIQGVNVTWRATDPGGLGCSRAGVMVGHAINFPGSNSCIVDFDMAQGRYQLAKYAAHEYGLCAQFRYLLSGIPRPVLGDYFAVATESFAETYAHAYLAACWDSLMPLGMSDVRAPACAEAPDPRGAAATASTPSERLTR